MTLTIARLNLRQRSIPMTLAPKRARNCSSSRVWPIRGVGPGSPVGVLARQPVVTDEIPHGAASHLLALFLSFTHQTVAHQQHVEDPHPQNDDPMG